jgi:dTDP-4-dehydrorhamnose reductase
MKILLTGAGGQVASALCTTLPPIGEVLALGRQQLDLADVLAIRQVVRSAAPAVIVNAAAYTAVDRAESEQDMAFAINAVAPEVLAQEAARLGALFVHFSTDYVFDGEKKTPYIEEDAPNPLNVYGRSKLAGERAIQNSGCRYLLLRTSWIYAEHGKNFLLTILRLAREGRELRVVDDQVGAPTSSAMIARAAAQAILRIERDRIGQGLFHMTATGAVTWCDFAKAILDAVRIPASVVPISSAEYPTAARRPRNSRMDSSKLGVLGISMPTWRQGLDEVLHRLQSSRRQ